MKKILSLSLILIIIVALLSACQQTNVAQQKYPRIIVDKEPSQSMHYIFQGYLGEYTELQDALNEIVDRYNTTHSNEDLFNICKVLHFREYFNNANEVVITYYSKIFTEIWTDNNFDKETAESQELYARILLNAMYQNDMQIESIEFFDKYLATIDDKDEKVNFSSSYFSIYLDDKNPDKQVLLTMMERTKELEKECYDEVDDFYKAAICSMISQYADKLNDKETAEIYKEIAIQIYEKLKNETSDE